jgi:hypothetical protein
MKAALILLAVVLAGCAAAPAQDPPRLCPPLPELPARATPEQQLNHTAVVIRLYAQCAGATGEQ